MSLCLCVLPLLGNGFKWLSARSFTHITNNFTDIKELFKA